MKNKTMVNRGVSFNPEPIDFYDEKESFFLNSIYDQMRKDRETPSSDMTRCKFRDGSLSETALAYAKNSGKFYFRNDLGGYFEADSIDGDCACYIGDSKEALNDYLETCYKNMTVSVSCGR